MIVNMGGGRAVNAFLKEFTVESVINDRDLVLENVDVPGGVVHGYALMITSTPNNVLISGMILNLSADLEKARERAETLTYYGGADVRIYKTEILSQAYTYDAETKTLTFLRFSSYVFAKGTYTLLIW